jgi:hypothetical protein
LCARWYLGCDRLPVLFLCQCVGLSTALEHVKHARVPWVAVPQAPPSVDLRAWRPVAAVACGTGIGLAVSPALGLIVTSCYTGSTISAYTLAGPDHRLLGTWGGTAPGPLQFDFDSGSMPSGGLCFTVPSGPSPAAGCSNSGAGAGSGGAVAAPPVTGAPQLLVASSGTRRVVVLDMGGVAIGDKGDGGDRGGGGPVPVGAFGGAGPDEPAPRCVAACAGLVAVSGWTKWEAGDHTVTLYAAGTWARVRVVGVGRGCGALDGQLACPYGLRFSADGARLLVAEYWNERVCCFRVSDGAFAGVVARRGAQALSCPYDVVEVAGALLVADGGNHRVVRVPADGSPATVLGGVKGPEPGQFILPTALSVSADGAQVIVRELLGGRFQVFGVEV